MIKSSSRFIKSSDIFNCQSSPPLIGPARKKSGSSNDRNVGDVIGRTSCIALSSIVDLLKSYHIVIKKQARAWILHTLFMRTTSGARRGRGGVGWSLLEWRDCAG